MSEARERCLSMGHGRLRGVRVCLYQDIQRFLNKSPENQVAGNTLKSRASALLTPQLLCLLLHRVSHYFCVNECHRLARAVALVNFIVHKVDISPRSCIGPGCMLPHPAGVVFDATAGAGLTLYSLCACGPHGAPAADAAFATCGRPVLGDRVMVGGHALVLGAIRVGNDVKIAPTIPLEQDAPDGVLVVSRRMLSTRERRSA